MTHLHIVLGQNDSKHIFSFLSIHKLIYIYWGPTVAPNDNKDSKHISLWCLRSKPSVSHSDFQVLILNNIVLPLIFYLFQVMYDLMMGLLLLYIYIYIFFILMLIKTCLCLWQGQEARTIGTWDTSASQVQGIFSPCILLIISTLW